MRAIQSIGGHLAVLLCASLAGAPVCAQAAAPETADGARIARLLRQLTLEEKIDLIRGGAENPDVYQGQAGYLPGVPRLQIPSLRFADGPPGVLTRVAAQAETCTMGLAATFSVKDAEANGVVIGREARALGVDVVLEPFINIDRDITWTRAYNTFGEDPLLTAVMGAVEIRGIQSQDVMAMAKHYIGYDSASYNVYIDPQTLHEVYLEPFEQAVKAGVAAIMCSYNRIDGAFACGNSDTLEKVLRGELGFKGFVTSDWGAVHSASFLDDGLDMEMPGKLAENNPFAFMVHDYFALSPATSNPPGKPDLGLLAALFGGSMPEEPPAHGIDLAAVPPRDNDGRTLADDLRDSTVTETTVTEAVRHVLHEMNRFGYLDGRQKHSVTAQAVVANAAVIRKTAEDAAVLLKNEGALPLTGKDLRSLALIGPGAGQVAAIGLFGERSPGLIERQIGPYQALRRLAPAAHIIFAVDDDMTGAPVGAAHFSHGGEPGLVRTDNAGHTRVDPQIDFTRANGRALPANGTYRWVGTLSIPQSGDYWIYLQALAARAVLTIDGKEIGRTGAFEGAGHGDVQYATQDSLFPTTDGLDNVRRSVQLTAGPHRISVQASGDTSDRPEQIRLNWMTPQRRQHDHRAAIEAAKKANAAVVFIWSRGKPVFGLPGDQNRLVEEVAAVNPNTLVVLNVSQPIALPWLAKVRAVLQMWWPGDEGGWATADLLLGRANPAGRLPFTWAKRLEDYPATDPAHPARSAAGVAGKTTFSEGVDVGYRWFDARHIQPLFPFGYGLSYSRFTYSGLKVNTAPDGGLSVTVRIKNDGPLPGDEVPQVYLDAPTAQPRGVQFAPRTLAAFGRVALQPLETKEITLRVPARSLEYWSIQQSQWVESAPRTVEVGPSSRDLRLHAETPSYRLFKRAPGHSNTASRMAGSRQSASQ